MILAMNLTYNYYLDLSMAISLVIIVVALVVGITLLYLRLVLARRARVLQGPACPQCRYNMSHLDRLECPECGHKVLRVSDWTRRERRWVPMLLLILAVPLLCYSSGMLWFVAGHTVQYVRLRSLIAKHANVHVAFLNPTDVWGAWRIPGFLREFTPVPWISRQVGTLNFRDSPITDKDVPEIASIKVSGLFLDGSSLTSAGLAQLKNAKGLEDIWFDNGVFDAARIQALADIPSVEWLMFNNARFNGAAIQNIGSSKSLTRLSLIRCAVDVSDLQRALASLPHLTYLELTGSTFQGRALPGLKNSSTLEHLDIHDTSLGDDCLAYLGDIPTIYLINAANTRIQGPGLASLKHAHLGVLDLSGTAVGDDCVELLADIPRLSIVILQNTRMTDAGLKQLASHPTLREIWVSPAKCSQAAVDAINAVTPNRVTRR